VENPKVKKESHRVRVGALVEMQKVKGASTDKHI
jgi:hypothetical protein